MRRGLGRVEERVRAPHLVDVVHTEPGVLEQVRRLVVDLEGVLVVEDVDVEQPTHTSQVYYKRIPVASLASSTDACCLAVSVVTLPRLQGRRVRKPVRTAQAA